MLVSILLTGNIKVPSVSAVISKSPSFIRKYPGACIPTKGAAACAPL